MIKLNKFTNILPAVCTFGTLRFDNFVNYIACIIIQSIVPFFFALSVATFIWGVVQYLIGAEEEAKRAQGRQFMIWGIIALTVMVSVWGLVQILGSTFGIQYIIPAVQNTTPGQ